MDIDIDRIIDIAAIKSGEFPDWRRRLDENEGCEATNLREMAMTVAEPLAIRLTLEADSQTLRDPKDIRADIYRQADWGEDYQGVYTLPDDFLRMHSLQMGDWPIILTDEYRGDENRLALGEEAPLWLKTRPRRPWMTVTATGSGTELRFGVTRRRMPRFAAYIAKPALDQATGKFRNLDPAILLPLAENLSLFIDV